MISSLLFLPLIVLAYFYVNQLNQAASDMEIGCRKGDIGEAIDLFTNVKQFSARTERVLQEVVD